MGLANDGQIQCYACQSSTNLCPGNLMCTGNDILFCIVYIIVLTYFSYNHFHYFKNSKHTTRTNIFNVSVIVVCSIETVRYIILSSLTSNDCFQSYMALNFMSQTSAFTVLFILELRLLNAVEVLRSYRTLQLTKIIWVEVLIFAKLCLFYLLVFINAIIGNYNAVFSVTFGAYLEYAIVVIFCLIAIPLIYTCIAIYRNLRNNDNVDKKVLEKVRKYFIGVPVFIICTVVILIITIVSDNTGRYSSMILEDLADVATIIVCFVCCVSVTKTKPELE